MARLSVRQKCCFGICDLGGNLFFTLMGFWTLKYLTDIAGLSAAWAGAAVMTGKLWDAVTDPAMGYISDRTISRWGRRRPYLLFGALPMMLSMWFFFTVPPLADPRILFAWAVFALMLVNTAATVINIPYSSLTPELSGDYHEKTSLNGYRFGCAVFGTLLGAAAVPPLTAFFSVPAAGGGRTGWSVTGLLLGAVAAVTALVTFFGTRETRRTRKDLPSGGFFSTYAEVFNNHSYVRLLVTYALHICGITFVQSILSYYTEYVYGRGDLTAPAMLILLVTAMAFIPVSVAASKRIGKKRTYQICFVILASACMILFFLGRLLGAHFFLGFMVYAGAGVGFSYVSPWAMIPDTIEFDAAKSGERKEGAYYGMWTFVSKLGMSLSMLVSGLILDIGGYAANAEQTAGARTAIRLLMGPIPAALFLAALFCIALYSLDEDRYRKILGSKTAI